MTWRRLAELLHMRHAVELQDERSSKAEQLAELERKTHAITVATHEMTSQSRVGSYRRVRIR